MAKRATTFDEAVAVVSRLSPLDKIRLLERLADMLAKDWAKRTSDTAQATISSELVSQLLALPSRQVWADYDIEADVLYISFCKPQQADDSVMEDDGSIYHYRDDELVGVTVVNASRKAAPPG